MANITRAKLSGRSLIGFREGMGLGDAFYATDPVTGQRLQPGLIPPTTEEIDIGIDLAAEVFDCYRSISPGVFVHAAGALARSGSQRLP